MLPEPAETIRLLAGYVNFVAALNSQTHPQPQHPVLPRFYARAVPTIDVQGYLERILRYAPCGSECFLSCLVYLRRMARASGQAGWPGLRLVANPVPRSVPKSVPGSVPGLATLAIGDHFATNSGLNGLDAGTVANSNVSTHLYTTTPPGDATQAGHGDRDDSDSDTDPGTEEGIIVNAYNIHRLLITGVMVSVKFMSDVFYTNAHVSSTTYTRDGN